MTKAVPYATLVGLLGKKVKDAEVDAVIAKAGKVSVKSDFIVAKEAGFDFALDKKVLSTLFLFGDGVDKHAGYADLPRGFSFTTREALLAALPAPAVTWKLGKGKVPVATDDVAWDQWNIDGFRVSASYRKGVEVRHLFVTKDEEEDVDLSTHPLHFETKPPDAPKDAELVGMALLVAWGSRHGVPAKHAAFAEPLAKRTITPRAFLVQACGGKLSSRDFVPALHDFLYEYEHHIVDDDGTRDAADKNIAKLIGYDRPERRAYTDDFVATFKTLGSAFYVPDSWAAVDRIAPVIDARFADYKATGFASAPDVGLYDKAAKLRDKVAVEPVRASVDVPAADDALADDLVALIGKPLTDKQVKAVLARANLPVGKRIDEQGNPALGVTYMGSKIEIAGKKVLAVTAVDFYARGQSSYVRGIGAEVEFGGYPAALPHGVALGEARASVGKKLSSAYGKAKASDAYDYWKPKGRIVSAEFAKGKLVHLHIGLPADY